MHIVGSYCLDLKLNLFMSPDKRWPNDSGLRKFLDLLICDTYGVQS